MDRGMPSPPPDCCLLPLSRSSPRAAYTCRSRPRTARG